VLGRLRRMCHLIYLMLFQGGSKKLCLRQSKTGGGEELLYNYCVEYSISHKDKVKMGQMAYSLQGVKPYQMSFKQSALI
jgi:hypothetical protein